MKKQDLDQQGNYIPAEGDRTIYPLAPHRTSMHVYHAARQIVNMNTSAVDRSLGYLIVFVPVSVALAILTLAVTISLWGYPLLSFTAFLVFWLTFVGVWVFGLVFMQVWTPEYISFYEARMKWKIIHEEQKERWDYYRHQAGMEREVREESNPLARIAIVYGVLAAIVAILYALVG